MEMSERHNSKLYNLYILAVNNSDWSMEKNRFDSCVPDQGDACGDNVTPWTPCCNYLWCDAGYCERCGIEDDFCGAGSPCCKGLVCDEWGFCDLCSSTDEACGDGIGPCCKGLSCDAGVCTPPFIGWRKQLKSKSIWNRFKFSNRMPCYCY